MSDRRRLPGTVAEIAAAPEGPSTGAFFDLDGTLIAGYSARYLAEQRLRDREFGPSEFVRTLGVFATGGGLNAQTFAELMRLGAHGWRGRAVEDIDELGLRLFEKKIADRIFPEMREIVRAHQARGHTVALTSSATTFQAEPVAEYLGIDHVICNCFESTDGVLTGEVVEPVIWGDGKADAVQRFATEHGVDLTQSYFYADGDEDTSLMYLVGNPRPTNPGSHMARVARKRGWPVLHFESRGSGSMLKSLAGLGSMLPIAGVGLGIGLLRRDPRAAINFVTDNWTRAIFAINSVEIDMTGEDNAWKQRPAVFIFNHRNSFDPFIAARVIKRDLTGVAKAELRTDPVVGTFGRLAGVAFVDRADTASAVQALEPLEHLAVKGLSVLIAPEGVRLDTTEVGPFKKGAFRIAMAAGIPIVPIVIRNAELIGGRDARTMNPGTVEVTVLEPIDVTDWTLEELPEHIEEVRRLYLETLADWPTGDR